MLETGQCVPEARRRVVERVHLSLHLVVQDDWTLFQSVAQQVLSHDDHSYSCAADILLGPAKDHPKLCNAKKKNKKKKHIKHINNKIKMKGQTYMNPLILLL